MTPTEIKEKFDAIVIDESHNFRNKKTPRVGSETRYDRAVTSGCVVRNASAWSWSRPLVASALPPNGPGLPSREVNEPPGSR